MGARRRLSLHVDRRLVGSIALVVPFVLASIGPPAVRAATARPPAESARVVTYQMDVSLDPESHEVSGTQRITWRNDSDESVPTLWWHLYLNGFENDRTTIALEGEGQGRRRGDVKRDARRVNERSYWGYCAIEEMTLADGRDLLAGLEYRQPDDGNEMDRTVARVVLPDPIPPGGSVTVNTRFVSKTPWARRRTGHAGDYYFMAQWYPKLAVYEGVEANPETEGWNCHQYHAHTEYYADFGTFRVDITVPEDYGGENGGRVGATGRRVSEFHDTDEDRWTYRFVQDDVHDFTWTADPDFIVIDRTYRHDERRTAAVLAEEAFLRDEVGVPAAELRLPDVEVRLLLQPSHAHLADRHFEAVFQAITWFGLWFGPYPYGVLTVVDPPRDGNRTGGMEYPTLITSGTRWRVPPAPSWPGPEGVTVHEFGHQYFYGLIGTNEAEEAWLDEGLNSYADDQVLDRGWGGVTRFSRFSHVHLPRRPVLPLPSADDTWSVEAVLHLRPFGLRRTSLADLLFQHPGVTWSPSLPVVAPLGSRSRYVEDGRKDPVDVDSWKTLDRRSYGAIAYSKPATMLTQFERVLGRAAFLRAMREYCNEYRFGHPNGTDFLRVLEEHAGLPVDEARRYLQPETLDYAVFEVKSKKIKPLRGLLPSGDDFTFVDRDDEDDDGGDGAKRYRSVVKIQRLGTLTAPVEIAVTFADADEPELHSWDGRSPWHALDFVREKKVVRVDVDPEFKLTLDVNRLNNGWVKKKSSLPAASWAARVLVLLQSSFLGARSLS